MPGDQKPDPIVRVTDGEEGSRKREILAYRLELEESQDAEQFHAVFRDLQTVVLTANYLVDILNERTAQQGELASVGTYPLVERSLYIAALVTYARCFGSGKRRRLDESIFFGDAEYLLDWHRYFIEVRNKHIAHSVNPFEVHDAIVWIEDVETESPKVHRVSVANTVRQSDDSRTVRQLSQLAAYAQAIAYGKMDTTLKKLQNLIDQWSAEELRALKPLVVYPETGPKAARSPRK